jgi:hypothetical protein
VDIAVNNQVNSSHFFFFLAFTIHAERMPFVVNGIMMSEPVIEPWEINRSGCVLCMYICMHVREEDYISLRWYYLLLFFSSSQHQGNYANKRIIRASKKLIWVKVFFLLFSLDLFYGFSYFFPVTVDPCSSYQCNQGTCQKDRGSQPFCSCYEGYGGSRCETQIGMFRKKRNNVHIL